MGAFPEATPVAATFGAFDAGVWGGCLPPQPNIAAVPHNTSVRSRFFRFMEESHLTQ